MSTGVIMRIFGLGLITAVSLTACSLDQRSGDSGMARIQLNTRAHTGGPAKLGTMSGNGMTAPTASSYYVVDVEGEGIPREVIESTKCVRASPISSAMVPALLQVGEAERTEIELLVPVGANRKIRIVRVDLTIPNGTATPQFGESPFRFKMRNPSYSVSADMFILAEAEIPFLNGDQSVTLTEKAVPESIPNLCQAQGGNQPPIANADVEDALKAVTRVGRMYRGVEAGLADANRQQRAALEKRLAEVEQESERALSGFLNVAVRDWENIERGGEPLPFSKDALKDMAQPKAPLFRLAASIAEDAASAQDPFADPVPA